MTPTGRGAVGQREPMVRGWQVCASPSGHVVTPAGLDNLPASEWISAEAPGTVAAVLRAAGAWSLDGPARRFDAQDWWYRVAFERPQVGQDETLWLGFDGLAGVAEVWLNGEPLLQSDNMHVAHERDVTGLLRAGTNTLVLRFQSLDALLAAKRARPRWRTPMVEHQQLRWLRQTVLGRTPGWTPPVQPVGLWQPVWLERRGGARVDLLKLRPSVSEDGAGVLNVSCVVPGRGIESVLVELEHGGSVHRAALARDACGVCSGTLTIDQPALWWPHTHGEPVLYGARLRINDEPIDIGRIGFRSVVLHTDNGSFTLRVNGVPVFCRGACWMPLDVVTLHGTPDAYRDAVKQVADAGMNMLRISGATVYESPAFFDACDEAGVMVWQEFMFANMDYPEHDAAFMASVQAEAQHQLAQWQAHPSLAVLCGNSEVEQQAAMWGAPRELWSPPLFHAHLKEWSNAALPDVPYWPSSAHGGAFPHAADAGTTSYYGVGAYLRPLDDARRADVKFTTECLGFANVPDERTLARMPGWPTLRSHHATWKTRAPRDLGAGWDFEDVRDHYLGVLFGVDALQCRYAQHDRYLALSRMVSAELMARSFAEWRRPGSRCGGALVWFLRDLWAGAGWGLLDDNGVPKACFHVLGRALQPVCVFITDEGGNGLVAHVVNERAQALDAELLITAYGNEDAVVEHAACHVQIAPRGAQSIPVAQCLAGFTDLSYAYRFGPPPAMVVHASLRARDGAMLSEAFFVPSGVSAIAPRDLGLHAHVDGGDLVVSSARFAYDVQIELDAHVALDNHFHLAPGTQRRVALSAGASNAPLRGRVSALNADRSVAVREQP